MALIFAFYSIFAYLCIQFTRNKHLMMRFVHALTEYWRRTPWLVVLLLFAIPFLIRNLLLPMVGDDFSYAFIWNGDDLGNLMDNIGPRYIPFMILSSRSGRIISLGADVHLL